LAAGQEGKEPPISRSSLVFTLPSSDLISEDIAYDARRKTFYVSSVRQRKVLAIDRKGRASDLIREGQDGVDAMLALAVDAKRDVLWATTAVMEQQENGYDAGRAGRTAVLEYSLADRRMLRRIDLHASGERHVLGDMTLNAQGGVFVTDSLSGAVYTIAPGADELTELVPPGAFRSPQTPALAPGGRLFVADYARGIAAIDLSSKAVSWLGHPDQIAVNGIDGLYLAGNTLIGMQSGTRPERVMRFFLDPKLTRIERAEAIESNTPDLGEPTHGVAVGDEFYFITNSGWDRVGKGAEFTPGAPPAIRKTRLLVN
jgi:sugar lactone lactonase YvrE